MMFSSPNSLYRQIACHALFDSALYPAFVEDLETVACLLDCE
jgi:hypothetical protein